MMACAGWSGDGAWGPAHPNNLLLTAVSRAIRLLGDDHEGVPTPSRVCSASSDAPTLLQACSPSIPHVHLVTSSITRDVMLTCDVMMFMCDTMLAQTLGFTGCLWWQWKNRSICPGVEVQKTSLCSLLLLPFHNLSSGTGLTLWGPLLCPMALEGDQSEHTPPCQGQNCSLYRCWAAFSAHGCPVCLADSWHHR